LKKMKMFLDEIYLDRSNINIGISVVIKSIHKWQLPNFIIT